MLKRVTHIFVIGVLVVAACGKKNKQPATETEEPPVTVTPKDTDFTCEDLPAPPPPFAWIDSMPAPDKAVNSFLYDPLNPDRIYYVVNGDVTGFNQLSLYTVPTGQVDFICSLGKYLPQLNKKGWITYGDVENNIYLLKENRGAPLKLTNNKRSLDPKWDHSGNYMYYFREAFGIYPARVEKISTTGELVGEVAADLACVAPFKKTDKVVVIEVTTTTTCRLMIKAPNLPEEDKELLSGALYSEAGKLNFENLVMDNNDEWVYWSNSKGIFRCQISTSKVDTILKNCPNSIFMNPLISFKDNELTYCQHIMKPLSNIHLLHQFKAMEMNLLTRESQEVKLFP